MFQRMVAHIEGAIVSANTEMNNSGRRIMALMALQIEHSSGGSVDSNTADRIRGRITRDSGIVWRKDDDPTFSRPYVLDKYQGGIVFLKLDLDRIPKSK